LADTLTTVFRPAGTEIIFKDFGEEWVVANLNSGLFYSLLGSAGTIWAHLVAGHTGRQIAAAFQSDDVHAVTAEIDAFIAKLIAEELLVPAQAFPVVSDLPSPASFSPPIMERFDDLQGLLLVDPIHDVSESGWPLMPSKPDSP